MKFFTSNLAKFLVVTSSVFVAPAVHAELILNYDSVLPTSGGSLTDLTRIDRQTDDRLVRSSGKFCRLGSDVAGGFIRDGFSNETGGAFANQAEIQFRFGSEPIGLRKEYALSNRGVAASNASGNYMEFIFTAAEDLELNEVAFRLFVNSENIETHAARDVAIFIDVDGRGFQQFDSIFEGKNSDNGVVVFKGAVPASTGAAVTVRLVFADKTNLKQNFQSATRIGDVQIYAKEVDYTGIPEPSAYVLLFGLVSLSSVAVRRRKRTSF